MKKKHRIIQIIFLLITAGWMLMTFYMSSRPAVESSDMSEGLGLWLARLLKPDYDSLPASEWMAYVDVVHTVVRKIAHFSEYCLLGVWIGVDIYLWPVSAIRREESSGDCMADRRSMKSVFLFSWIMASLYAVTDEVHQLFVEGRSGEVLDVLIDSGGALTGAALVCLVLSLVRPVRSDVAGRDISENRGGAEK